MKWSGQQDAALAGGVGLAEGRRATQVFRLFGYAGYGQNHPGSKQLAEDVDGEVAFGAFTGKAALVVLRQKGCRNASTIHSA